MVIWASRMTYVHRRVLVDGRAAFWLVALLMVGCISGPRPLPDEGDEVLLRKPTAACHEAALTALSVDGFDVKKNEPDYIEGARPRRMNLIWGTPGGETIAVWLKPAGPDSTRVIVKTEKSLVGLVGQKNWGDDVIRQMTEELGR